MKEKHISTTLLLESYTCESAPSEKDIVIDSISSNPLLNFFKKKKKVRANKDISPSRTNQ